MQLHTMINPVRHSRPVRLPAMLLCVALFYGAAQAGAATVQAEVQERIDGEYPSLQRLYLHLHTHPELSLHEAQTGLRIAEELRAAGFDVTSEVGGHGVVGVLRNGAGPVVLLRTDLDALPVLEQTGAPYASHVKATNDLGNE